jgi:hypothetical protein
MRAVNLIPADQRSRGSVGAGRSGGAAYAVLGTIAGLAVMAVLYGVADHQVSSRTAEAKSLTERAEKAQAAASQLAPYTNFVALRQARTEAVETLVGTRFDWAHSLHELGRVLPAGASISTITGTVGSATGGTLSSSSSSSKAAGAAVASATPAGSLPSINVTGCAVNQAAVAQTIDRLRLMDGVSNVVLTTSTRTAANTTASNGTCGEHQASYALTIDFQPLPAANAGQPAAHAVAATSAGASAPSATTSGTGGSPR